MRDASRAEELATDARRLRAHGGHEYAPMRVEMVQSGHLGYRGVMKRAALGLVWFVVACGLPARTTTAPAPSALEVAAPVASVEPDRAPAPAEPAPEDAGVSPPIAQEDAAPAPVEPPPLTPEALALKAACAKRRALACDELASVLRKADRLVEVREAYAAACALALVAGCGHYAWALEEGIGGAREPEKGKALHERSCRMGHAPSCERLGQLADRANDPKTALGFWSRACELSGGSPCRQVGEHHRDGRGTAVDFAAARRAFTRACDTRDGTSCLLLCDVGSQIQFCKNRR